MENCVRTFGVLVSWTRTVADRLPFGPAPVLILLTGALAGACILSHPVAESTATLRFWTFAADHAKAYELVKSKFEARHPGVKVDIQVVHADAVTRRLRAAFWADLDVPDLVEVVIDRAGSFFRGPVEGVGFVDLKPYLERSGLLDKVVKARLAPYTYRGRMFGLPHDVHPVMIAYRRDLFEELGIDPSKLQTWDEFVRVGRAVTIPGERYMVRLDEGAARHLEALLYQKDWGYFDAEGELIIDDEVVVETIRWLVPLAAGEGRIGVDVGSSGQAGFAQALESGYILSCICPDWESKSIQKDVARLAGKMALMPLPAFEEGGRRTSTRGGTMLAITKKCKNKKLAWDLAEYLYFDVEDLAVRFRETNILPPLKDAWSHPVYNEPRAYWSNQPIGAMYAELARDVPAQYSSPFVRLTKSKMRGVMSACVTYYNGHGEDGFDEFIRRRLAETAAYIRRQMSRNPF